MGTENSNYDLPILLRFRDLKNESSILLSIIELFGIPYISKVIEVEEIKEIKSGVFEKVLLKQSTIHVGDTPIEIFLVSNF